MVIEITSDGYLQILRAGSYKTQICPDGPERNYCGDWCPFFGEPTIGATRATVRLCRRTLIGSLTDRRKGASQ